jgi:GT2 family glycosyltransferase
MIDRPSVEPRFSETGYVEGRCLAIRARALDQVGKLDEVFFAYWEEVDLCYRVRALGWQVFIDLQSRVQDAGITSANSRLREYLLVRNRIYFVQKQGRALMVLSTIAWVLTLRLGQAILRRSGSREAQQVVADRLSAVRDALRLMVRLPADPGIAALTRSW